MVCGRREHRLLEAQARLPGLRVRVCDVAQAADRVALAEWASANFKGLNVIVNNAGIQRDIDFTEGIAEYLAGENEIGINLESPIVLSGLVIHT